MQELTKQGLLKRFPDHSEIDKFIDKQGRDLKMIEFIAEATWRGSSFASVTPGHEEENFKALVDLIQLPQIFLQKKIVRTLPDGRRLLLGPEAPKMLSSLGFNLNDISLIEAFNRRAAAYIDLGRNLNLNVYPTLRAVPHHFGSVKFSNFKARQIVESIKTKVLSLDDSVVGEADFHRLPIPPLTQVILEKAKDSPNAIASEMIDLRRRQATFRGYLTEYERKWAMAKSRRDRQKLDTEFSNAWAAFIKRMEKSPTRIIYMLWDVLKSPTDILKSIGDKLADRGKELSAIGKVRGLHDFWQELAASPVPENNLQLLKRLFPKLSEQSVWRAATAAAATTNHVMGIRSGEKPPVSMP